MFKSLSLLGLCSVLLVAGCDCSKENGGGGDGGDGGEDASTDTGVDSALFEPCGDSHRGITESCDDGNMTANDGCSAVCQIEAGYRCPFEGQACIAIVCNDPSHQIEAPETCEDGNTTSGDGCSATCQLEPGWTCPLAGAGCSATACGDGLVAGAEACDDDNTTPGDGCSATCQLEAGHHCPVPGAACTTTRCGDGVTQGLEQCDNDVVPAGTAPDPYDGCDRFCNFEPSCTGGTCVARCGDGVVLPGSSEACDDGNTRNFDGCSSTCTVEPGYMCTLMTLPPPATVTIPTILRDFRGKDLTPGHPDFQPDGATAMTGITQATLDPVTGRPRRAATNPDPGNGSFPSSAASFLDWYTDVGGSTNATVYSTLTLTRVGATTNYQFPAPPAASGPNYFPLDGLGFNVGGASPFNEAGRNGGHNFHFTTELHYWFEYKGTEVLNFVGDDDLWVFVDGKLCVDLGGQHGADPATMDFNNLGSLPVACRSFVVGKIYEMAIFNAERHTTESNFFLTLGNFVKRQSVCTAMCGDGERAFSEVCDLGTAMNMGGYDQCSADCTALGPHCGDGILQADHEACDDGVNNTGGYNHCTPGCVSGGVCGDGVRQGPEQCDDGVNNGTFGSLCLDQCVLRIE